MGGSLSWSSVSLRIVVALTCLAVGVGVGVGAGSASASSQLYEPTANASIELEGRNAAPMAGTFRLALSGLCVSLPGSPTSCNPIAFAVTELDLSGDGVELRKRPLPEIPFHQLIGYDTRLDEANGLVLGTLVLDRVRDTGIGLGDTEACVSGELDGAAFLACDSVEVYPNGHDYGPWWIRGSGVPGGVAE